MSLAMLYLVPEHELFTFMYAGKIFLEHYIFFLHFCFLLLNVEKT